MALETRPLHIIILSILVANSIVSATADGQKLLRLGRWWPITEAERQKAVELSNFAVDRHNKLSRSNLKLMSLINGTVMVLGGTYYKLLISAVDDDAPNNYSALVYEKSWQHNFRFLIKFDKLANLLV